MSGSHVTSRSASQACIAMPVADILSYEGQPYVIMRRLQICGCEGERDTSVNTGNLYLPRPTLQTGDLGLPQPEHYF